MSPVRLSCEAAREHLSARSDGEPCDEAALRVHLARCAPCRAHELALAALARELVLLRAHEPPLADLWPRIERRARPRQPALGARVAAALAGVAAVALLAFVLERERRAPRLHHLLDALAPHEKPSAIFAALPEYRVLRALPQAETSR